jgi:hypothetical protein
MSQPDDSGATPGIPEIFTPVSYEPDAHRPDPGIPAPGQAWSPGDGGWTHDETRQRPRGQRIWPDTSWPPRKPARRRRARWAVSALAALAGAGAVVGLVAYFGGSPAPARGKGKPAALAGKSTRPAAAHAALVPPVSVAGARDVLAGYTAGISAADARLSPAVLGTVAAQGSYALMAGYYRQLAATRARPPAAYAPRSARFYIPLEPSAYPHWFAVQVVNETSGRKPAVLGTQYLVFVRPSAGAPWKEADQPYVLGTPPAIMLSPAGYATAVGDGAAGLAVAPSQIAAATASSLNGRGPVPAPGNLAEDAEAAGWRHGLGRGASVSLTHAAAGYPVFGLRTAGGGALLFYSDTAQLTARPARHGTIRLSVPGYYNGRKRVRGASLGYLDQFAAYDPPATIPGLSIVADYSGIIP